MAQPTPKIPFRYGTRQRFQPVPVTSGATFAASGTFSTQLPKVGLLNTIILRLNGTVSTTSGNITPAVLAPYNILSDIRVDLNLGATTLYRTSGYGNYLLSLTQKRGNGGSPFDHALSSMYYWDPATGGSSKGFTVTYRIPIAANDGINFAQGLINLQAPELVCTVSGAYNSLADGLGSGTGLSCSATLDVGYEYYELPDPTRVEYPPLVFHRVLEDVQPITAAGDQTYEMPRGGVLHKLIHTVLINNALSNPSRVQVRFNKADTVYDFLYYQLQEQMARKYSRIFPAGSVALDFWSAEGHPSSGDNRDMISSEALSTLESIVTTSTPSGTVNQLRTIREISQIVSL